MNELPAVKQCFQGQENEKLCSFIVTSAIVTSAMVKSTLLKLKMNKGPGGTRMLLELSKDISVTVAELFNKSLKSGDVHQDWKIADVTAVY